jgi:hypothetical protein
MEKTIQKRLRALAKSEYIRLRKFARREKYLIPDYQGQAASDTIRALLDGPEPCMICRFGHVELDATLRYVDIRAPGSRLSKWARYLSGASGPFVWDERIKAAMRNNAGFFPADEAHLARFAGLMLESMPAIDVLGSWLPGEARLAARFSQATLVDLPDLEPYYHANPWSEALAGKTVLVIHPFAQSIQRQYARHERLFADRRVLPEFKLQTLQAVQTIAGNPAGFATWFEALEWMRQKVRQTEFDIAIIGAGAYGLPLAAHVKMLGKKAVHLGGAVQILFGIRGKRWDNHPVISRLYNEYWVRPAPEETPQNYQAVETGCYW